MSINLAKIGRGFPVIVFYPYNRGQPCCCSSLFNTLVLLIYLQTNSTPPASTLTSTLGRSVCQDPELLRELSLLLGRAIYLHKSLQSNEDVNIET